MNGVLQRSLVHVLIILANDNVGMGALREFLSLGACIVYCSR